MHSCEVIHRYKKLLNSANMEDGTKGTSSGAIHGTPLQMAAINTLAANASTVTRMQNLEGPGETPHITTVETPHVTTMVRHQDATMEV
ncbi:unnamed protein product [Lactuca virosa]|uniref:Uncharacterized protein n=1 Tax=Lactuca virosa TaxID=75947 RepID=A0AAU9MQM6_9ASTR|nr:unnamed protein product [Lactuca virosa]